MESKLQEIGLIFGQHYSTEQLSTIKGRTRLTKSSKASKTVVDIAAVKSKIDSLGVKASKAGDILQFEMPLPDSFTKIMTKVVEISQHLHGMTPGQSQLDKTLQKQTFALMIDQRKELLEQAIDTVKTYQPFRQYDNVLQSISLSYMEGNEVKEFTDDSFDGLFDQIKDKLVEYELDTIVFAGSTMRYVVFEPRRNNLKGKDDDDSNTTTVSKLLSNGYYVISPNTRSHCFSMAVSLILQYRKEDFSIELFQSELYEKSNDLYNAVVRRRLLDIAKKSGEDAITDDDRGFTYEEAQMVCREYGIQLIDCIDDALFQGHFEQDDDTGKNTFVQEDSEVLLIEKSDCYIFIRNNHACVLLPPSDRSELLFHWAKRNERESQKQMEYFQLESDKPEDERNSANIVYTYDFEWVLSHSAEEIVDGQIARQIPYSFGLYEGAEDSYSEWHMADGELFSDFYYEFLRQLAIITEDKYIVYKPWLKANKKNRVNLILYGFNSNKCDFSLVEKALIDDGRFQIKSVLQTGHSRLQICVVMPEFPQVYLLFQDFLHHFRSSLSNFVTSMKCDVLKGEVDHNAVNFYNVCEEIERQDIVTYQKNDCVSLYQGIVRYDEQVKKFTGFSILENNILTASSIAERYYFREFIEFGKQITRPTVEMNNFFKQAYSGGMTDNFFKGVKENCICLDINSSYPHQMSKAPLPVGSYAQRLFNDYYRGESLVQGIYQVIITKSPTQTNFPCLWIQHEGRLCFPRMRNQRSVYTSEEIEYAYKQGYEIYLEYGYVTMNSVNVYEQYIGQLYQMRLAEKDEQQKNIIKLLLNSTYGKLAYSDTHQMSNMLSSNPADLFKKFKNGQLKSLKVLSEKYFSWSGVEKSVTKRTNHMMAAFITARARLQLIQQCEALTALGYQCLYTDTDSIIVHIPDDKLAIYKEEMAQFCHDTRLGAFKDETKKKTGSELCTVAIVAPKMYGLLGAKESVMAKGIPEYMKTSAASFNEARMKRGGQDQAIGFETIKRMALGHNLTVSCLVDTNNKKLLSSTYDVANIKSTRLKETTISGQVSKRDMVGTDDGNYYCIPKFIFGNDQAPPKEYEELKEGIFSTQQECEDFYHMTFDKVCDKLCVVKIEPNFTIYTFTSTQRALDFARTKNEGLCHQPFGNYMVPTIDIDFYPQKELVKTYRQQIDKTLNELLQLLTKHLGIPKPNWSVVNRSREVDTVYKMSFHLRIQGALVMREDLGIAICTFIRQNNNLRAVNPLLCSLINSINLNIYQRNHSLRITDDLVFDPTLPIHTIDHTVVKNLKLQAQRLEDNKVSNVVQSKWQKAAEAFLKKSKLKGWTFRDAHCYGQKTTINLNRTHEAAVKCRVCQKDHDRDNTLYLQCINGELVLKCRKALSQ